ncbi:PREDICTED: deoxyribose-phosphate aldolase [Wasmannia auropunctata]|uniref:deoxyribose-phosphate aldolase n=1 Tax=Wasmannia auropunctata TaxID=64793 RepID=UPI0005EF4665|nr:PREDICTED: deoxyribose-phosphate aldolase [Wasmannia auropunctata]
MGDTEDNPPKTIQMNCFTEAWLKSLDVYINEPAVNKSVRQIVYLATTITGTNKVAWLLKAISFIDLTTLGNDDTSSTVEELCKNAANPIKKLPFQWDKPLHTAAVCVYPSKIKDAISTLKKLKRDNVIKIASVAAGFPSGQYPLETRLQEVRCAIQYGAQEIDVVIDRSLVLSHEWLKLYEELSAIRSVCNEVNSAVQLKVILSSGELFNLKDVYRTSMIALFAGADFIKTSTGKDAVNATLPTGIVMCRAIKEYQRLTSKKIGFKPAGGIKTAQEALEWMALIKEELGKDWLRNDRFRIGASSLLQDISTEIIKTYEATLEKSQEASEEKISSVKKEEKKEDSKN